jgi:hypothetical protein
VKGAFGFAVTEAPLRQETATAYNAARLPQPAACHLFHARSTVATMTEIHDFLRVLYTRVGTAHCPECGTVLEAQPRISRAAIAEVPLAGLSLRPRRARVHQATS